MLRTQVAGCFLALCIGALPALAQDNLQKLEQVKTTGYGLKFEMVEQGGPNADAIRENLQRIKLPPGFKIDLYAIVPDARHMVVGANVGVVFVGTRKTAVYAVTDRNKDRVADEVKPFAPSIDFAIPNGVCMSRDGFLFIVEQNRVVVFPAAEFFYEGPDVAAGVVVKQGELIPKDEESFNHTARVCRVGPDNKLYITVGQPFNVPPPEKADLYNEFGIGGIIRMDRDGRNREVYAHGVRNSVGMDFNPANGELWFTDNQVDGMGDDIPPGELNRATGPGQHFGFPWLGGGSVRTMEYKDSEPPADAVSPQVETVAHAADLGMNFYTGRMFPLQYRGGIFSAQHGSWNRTVPVGARVMFTSLNEDGTAKETVPFAEGWLIQETGEYLGRPVDVAQLPDGSLLVSDDLAGAIYRISYQGS
ncbi:MAG TPA: PQQ-dependent sugar dehydrogenase [Sinorhizobium sp.]|nr:PQQ-dependent sugar dehydrogenase [Sinorhizobium sp.]